MLDALVRRHDPDRYFATIFAPAAARDTLFTLYAFNHELARAREAAREPGLALIRLTWWREVLEGARRGHEVASPLSEALDQGTLQPAPLLAMIDAREAELDPDFPDTEAWWTHLSQGAGTLAAAAGFVLGATPEEGERLRHLGAGYGAGGVLRSTAILAAQGRCLLPADLLAAHGLDRDMVIAAPGSASAACRALAATARERLGPPAPLRRAIVAAALPAVLARRDLCRADAVPRPRGIGDRLAVTLAAIRGRV